MRETCVTPCIYTHIGVYIHIHIQARARGNALSRRLKETRRNLVEESIAREGRCEVEEETRENSRGSSSDSLGISGVIWTGNKAARAISLFTMPV